MQLTSLRVHQKVCMTCVVALLLQTFFFFVSLTKRAQHVREKTTKSKLRLIAPAEDDSNLLGGTKRLTGCLPD